MTYRVASIPPQASLLAVVAIVAGLAFARCHYDNGETGAPTSELPHEASGDEGTGTSHDSGVPHPAELAADLPRAAAPLAVGVSAPAIRVSTESETFDSHNTLSAGPLVLVFYIGDFCIYCRRQLEQIQSRLGDFRSAGATVWAISADPPATSSALTHTLSLTFPVASDPSLEVIRAFGVESSGSNVALPSVFVLAPNGAGGRVVYQHVGANQADRAAIDDILTAVRTATHDH